MTDQIINRKAGIPQGILIILISILPMMAVVALMPAVPAIKNQFIDVPYIKTLTPLLLSAPGFCVALFSPFAGMLTDKLGRRRLLLIFTALYGFGGILPFFIEDFYILFGGRLILGIGEAFILTIGNALLGDYFNQEERAKWLMWQGIIGSLTGTLMLSFTGYLSTIGWNYPFLIYLIAFIVSGGAFFWIFEPGKKTDPDRNNIKSGSGQFPYLPMIKIAVYTLTASVLYFVYTLHFSLALEGIGITDGKEIGNYSAIASIAVPIGAILFKLISRRDSKVQFATLFLLIGTGLTFIGLSFNIYTVVAAAWLQQLGSGMAIPVLISWGLRNVPEEFRGRGMGFWTSGFFLGQFLSPLAVSFVENITGDLLSAFIIFGMVSILLSAVNLISSKGFGTRKNLNK